MSPIDRAPEKLSGRDDGPGAEHNRWFKQLEHLDLGSVSEADVAIVGFASDEGVRRNKGRQGAKEAPAALRSALAGFALTPDQGKARVVDLGDVVVEGEELEAGQERLAQIVSTVIDAGTFPLVFGGGHEVAFGTYSGVSRSATRQKKHIGILNLDAHFDLRQAEQPSSGTPFRQALEAEKAAGTAISYAVVGISQPSNTQVLFDTAHEFEGKYLLDEQSQITDLKAVKQFVGDFIYSVDLLYLTVDLDVLPASVAPGVSAPAGFGVPLPVILECVNLAAESGKLAAADIAELNPSFDIDGQTARTAARIAHNILTHQRKI
ncbi:formimidoylglutamase [uncultured Rothia sp.]|uniref:formimidoylglutamase n=1 Tax=uncultured Rothia sp. TaxID=316088 RepID=UPI003216BA9B